MEKQLILRSEEVKEGLPPDLVATRIKGITNPAVLSHKNGSPNTLSPGDEFQIFARLIYEDPYGDNSAIVKYDAKLQEDGLVKIVKDSQRIVFSPISPLGGRGLEDLRFAFLAEEPGITHAFLVYHDGQNARTGYRRNENINDTSSDSWHNFGAWFPNILAQEACSLVPTSYHKKAWRKAHLPNWRQRLTLSLQRKIDPDHVYKTPFYLGTKDCSLWPRKVNGKYAIPIRLFPDMQIVQVSDFLELARREFWQDIVRNLSYYMLLERKYDWEASHIGLCGQPVETPEGTFIFEHGAVMKPRRRYVMGAALANPDNPQEIWARTPEPILVPDQPWEFEQEVVSGDVIFPTAHLTSPDRMIVHHFYGASDKNIGYASQNMKRDILDKMETQ